MSLKIGHRGSNGNLIIVFPLNWTGHLWKIKLFFFLLLNLPVKSFNFLIHCNINTLNAENLCFQFPYKHFRYHENYICSIFLVNFSNPKG